MKRPMEVERAMRDEINMWFDEWLMDYGEVLAENFGGWVR
jgi:hypothetical protein